MNGVREANNACARRVSNTAVLALVMRVETGQAVITGIRNVTARMVIRGATVRGVSNAGAVLSIPVRALMRLNQARAAAATDIPPVPAKVAISGTEVHALRKMFVKQIAGLDVCITAMKAARQK